MFKKENETRDFTRPLKAECKKFKLDVREKAFADLMIMGWKDKDAYMAAGLFNLTYSATTNDREMNKLLLDDEMFRKYIKITEGRLKRGTRKTDEDGQQEELPSEEEVFKSLTKESQLTELYLARKEFKRGSKEWVDLSKIIADITQAKKDEIKEEDTTIHYYMPLSCHQCSLYAEAKKKRHRSKKEEE